MLFNSLAFFVFFPTVVALHFAVPQRGRWVVLFIGSSIFYMAFIPSYILILYAIILLDFGAALWIERTQGARRKLLLGLSVAANIGVLAAFKYLVFVESNIMAFAHLLGVRIDLPRSNWVLPIGLSFHTFQSLAYTIEVYRGRWRAERHLGIYAVYVLFFPQMVAGPIERPFGLLRELKKPVQFEPDRVAGGLLWMLIGFVKKILIADTLAPIVSEAYANPTSVGCLAIAFALVAFSVQIYADFSGYTDIARGAARVLGYDLIENFRRPYRAVSVTEFWHRWHISLSTWFRDYVYVPLGGSRRGAWRTTLNLLVVFAVSGLWHGAAWTFVVWGLLHGLAVAWERWAGEERLASIPRFARWAATFGFVSICWVFFRAPSFAIAMQILRGLGRFSRQGLAPWNALVVLICSGIVLGSAALDERRWEERLALIPAPARVGVYACALMVLAVFGRVDGSEFIYFQF
jgi:D-alanyl-lipoteichoic acid acyltransferase DltB (MBOAT superfamily)